MKHNVRTIRFGVGYNPYTRIQSVTLTFAPVLKNMVHENRSRLGCGYGEGEGGLPETK